MTPGIIRYDKEGKPICEICGKAFKRPLSHARQKHGISARDYKIRFGYDTVKGICSQESHDLARERVYKNASLCIDKNLLNKGKATRLQKGSPGRVREKVSAQTLIALKTRLLNTLINIKAKNNGNTDQNKTDTK